ncbi:MAG: hypothetical protein ACEQSK_20670 [Sphingomonadaceae bacterium]
MKRHRQRQLQRAARQYHRDGPPLHLQHGLLQRYHFAQPQPARSWWHDVVFILNDHRVSVHWIHPRLAYEDAVDAGACAQLPEPATSVLAGATPLYRAVGRARKRQRGWQLAASAGPDQAYVAAQHRLCRDGSIRIVPSLQVRWNRRGRCVDLCAPLEVRNLHELQALVALVRRLLKRETTLAAEFPGYHYERTDWAKEMMSPQ